MKTTVKHVGSEREWKGSINQWEKHKECIIHWCDGGEVEFRFFNKSDWVCSDDVIFRTDCYYRKKQRVPKVGEVWGNCNKVWVRAIDESEDFDGWFRIDGQLVDTNTSTEDLVFLSNNLEEYYKKRLLSD
jgi:hypothetical protein